MPISVIKGSWDYCTKNIWFFLFVLILLFILEFFSGNLNASFLTSPIVFFILLGYGLQVTKDVIDGGNRLPKIMPRKLISYLVMGGIVFLFYVTIQIILLAFVSSFLNFPMFEMEDLFLKYHETINLFINHDVVSFTIFVISGFVIVYVTSFFMELALARLADGGNLKEAFNFARIKHAIDVIGWKRYTLGYSKIIFCVIILTFVHSHLISPYGFINVTCGVILDMLTFVIEYRGIGIVYKVYTDAKRGVN